MNPCVFIVGCPRSGTTLLQRMLDAHPQLAVANDSHFIPRALEAFGHDGDVPLTPALVDWVKQRSEERRVGKECAILCRSRWSPYH